MGRIRNFETLPKEKTVISDKYSAVYRTICFLPRRAKCDKRKKTPLKFCGSLQYLELVPCKRLKTESDCSERKNIAIFKNKYKGGHDENLKI